MQPRGGGLAGATQGHHQWARMTSLPSPLCQCEIAVLQTPRAHAEGAEVLLLSMKC